jgi:hypothetical protein
MTFQTRKKPVFAGSEADGTLTENRHRDWQNAAAGSLFRGKHHLEVETLRPLGRSSSRVMSLTVSIGTR